MDGKPDGAQISVQLVMNLDLVAQMTDPDSTEMTVALDGKIPS